MDRPRVFVGLGSNLGDRSAQLSAAIGALSDMADIELLGRSEFFHSAAWGNENQPDFVNAVAEIRTRLSPTKLLQVLLHLEQATGRVRAERWGPRELDLDILAYGQCVFRTPQLRLPHPGIAEREFVLRPWAQIASEFMVVGLGRVKELLERFSETGVHPLETQPED